MPLPQQHTLFSVHFYSRRLNQREVGPTVVLTCVALAINDAECLFMGLLAPFISSLEKCLLRYFAHFDWITTLFVAECYEFSTYSILDIIPSSGV